MTQDNDKLSINNLRALAQHSIECYRTSYDEVFNIHEYFHGRQLSAKRLESLNKGNIPHLYENLIKKNAYLITGHSSSVVNTVKINAQQEEDVDLARILNDLINYDFRRNAYDTDQGLEVVLQGYLTGIFSILRMPVETGKVDEFGRPNRAMLIEHVPIYDLILDPNSKQFDYSDAEWVMRVQWLSENQIRKSFPELSEEDIANLPRGGNSIGGDAADRLDRYGNYYDSVNCGNSDKFHLVHTVIVDGEKDDGNGGKIDKVWSVYWCGNVEIERKEISYRRVKFPYQIFKLHSEDTEHEFYGLFRDAIGHQDAVNNALLALHRAINTSKKIVGPKAFKDINKANIEMTSPNVLFVQAEKIDEIRDAVGQSDIANQLTLIEYHTKAIEAQLGINQAFLGVTSPGDSGRLHQLARQSTAVALTKHDRRVQQFYRQLARDMSNFYTQFYTFHQVYNVADTRTADRFIEINRPVEIFVDMRTGQTVDIEQTPQGIFINGQLVSPDELEELSQHIKQQMVFEKVRDPSSGEELKNEKGENLYAPIPTRGSEIRYFDHDIIVDTAIYNNEEEISMNLTQNFLNSTGGQLMAQMHPQAYLLAFARLARGMKTTATNDVAAMIESVAAEAQPTTQQLGSSARPKDTEPK